MFYLDNGCGDIMFPGAFSFFKAIPHATNPFYFFIKRLDIEEQLMDTKGRAVGFVESEEISLSISIYLPYVVDFGLGKANTDNGRFIDFAMQYIELDEVKSVNSGSAAYAQQMKALELLRTNEFLINT